jgi:hypothetical protein
MLFASSALLPASIQAERRRELLWKQDLASAGQGPPNEENELAQYKLPSVHRLQVKNAESAMDSTCSEATVAVMVKSPQIKVVDVDSDWKGSMETEKSVDEDEEYGTGRRPAVVRDATCSWFDWTPNSPPEVGHDLERALSEGESVLPPQSPETARLKVPIARAL